MTDRAPYVFATHATLKAVRREFAVGELLKEALSIVFTLAELASDNRARGGGDTVEVGRRALGELAGASASTVDRVALRLVDAGIITVTPGPTRTAPKLWVLHDDPAAALARRGAAEAVLEAPVDEADVDSETPADLASGGGMLGSLLQGDANLASGGRKHLPQGDASSLYTGAVEATEEEERQQRDARAIGRVCERMRQHDPVRVERDAEVHAALLIGDDGRTLEEILDLVDWLGTGTKQATFWTGRIRTVRNLRTFFAQAVAVRNAETKRMRGQGKAKPPPAGPDPGCCCIAPGERPMAVEDEWKALLPQLRKAIGRDETFDLWIGACHPHADQHGALLVAAPAHQRPLIAQKFGRLIDRLAGRPIPIVGCEQETP